MPKLNHSVLLNNVSEARMELQRIEEALTQDPKPSEGELQVQFEHAFHHLNFAWNARRTMRKQHTNLSDKDFNQWSKFPQDINILKVPVRRKRKNT